MTWKEYQKTARKCYNKSMPWNKKELISPILGCIFFIIFLVFLFFDVHRVVILLAAFLGVMFLLDELHCRSKYKVYFQPFLGSIMVQYFKDSHIDICGGFVKSKIHIDHNFMHFENQYGKMYIDSFDRRIFIPKNIISFEIEKNVHPIFR